MTREFVYTRRFLKEWKQCGFDDDDLGDLEYVLSQNPKIGPVIENTNGARKVRFAFENQGKSGSTRVIYIDFEIGEKICGLMVYAKSDKANLTDAEKKEIRKLIKEIEPIYNVL